MVAHWFWRSPCLSWSAAARSSNSSQTRFAQSGANACIQLTVFAIWSAMAALRLDPQWPNGARLALNFVLNIEEGSEYSIENGDGFSEASLTEMGDSPVPRGHRDLAAESMFEFGSRVGIWRILELFAARKLPLTAFACAMVLERLPAVAAALREAGHDVCCHGWRWVEHYLLSEDEERRHIAMAVESLSRTMGAPRRRLVLPVRAQREHATSGSRAWRLSVRQRYV